MESISYSANLDASRNDHWFFVGRASLLRGWLATFTSSAPLQILDYGAGTGSSAAVLSEFGAVTLVEPSVEARRLAASRGLDVLPPDGLPAEARFDVITLLDVLEHVEEDSDLLSHLRGRLKPGGVILVTVPAHAWLWNYNDVISRHVRRYSTRGLRKVIVRAGLREVWTTHYNFFLLPAAILVAIRDAFRSRRPYDPADPFAKDNAYLCLPPRPINGFLAKTMGSEGWFFKRGLTFPVGISICSVLSGEPGS